MNDYAPLLRQAIVRAAKAEAQRDALLRMIDSWDVDPDMTEQDWLTQACKASTLGNDGVPFADFVESSLQSMAVETGIPLNELTFAALQERVEAYQWLREVEEVDLWHGSPIDSNCLVNALDDYRKVVECAKKAVEG